MSTRVLVVDDIPANVRLLEARLHSDLFSVKSVTSGLEALVWAHQHQPDLILLDVMMPGMDGFLCCAILKHDANTAHIPVIILTALDDVQEKIWGLEAGADDFLSKPVDYDILVTRASNLVRVKRLSDEWRVHNHVLYSLNLSPLLYEDDVRPNINVLLVGAAPSEMSVVESALRLERADVLYSENAAEALLAMESQQIDLVAVVVSKLPGVTTRLISAIRSNSATHNIPILLIVEPNEKEVASRCFDLGANDWVTLPLETAELRVRCRNLLKKTFYQEGLKANYQLAIQAALVDPLTNLHNKRFLSYHLQTSARAGNSYQQAVMVGDIDHFKTINDMYGHPSGDKILKGVADVILASVRQGDIVVRYGGEEFVVISMSCSLQEAEAIAATIKDQVEQRNLTPDRRPVTLSIGLAYAHNTLLSLDQVLEIADQALYKAKRNGRNRVETIVIDRNQLPAA